MKRIKTFFKRLLRRLSRRLEWLNDLPVALKRLMAVSGAALLTCIIVMGVMLPKINAGRQQYEESSRQQRELERQMREINIAYYSDMIDKGFFDITDSENNSVWMDIYPYLLESMGYRVLIDGRLVTGEYNIPLYRKENGQITVVRIEEYIKDNSSAYAIPRETLIKYSYLITAGSGQERDVSDIAEVVTTPQGNVSAEYSMTLTRGSLGTGFVSALEIELTSAGIEGNLSSSAHFNIIIKDQKLLTLINLLDSVIEVIHD